MSKKNTAPNHVVTGKCRLSYAHIWEAASINGEGPEKYSACIVIPKSDKATLAKLARAQKYAVAEGVKSKWKGKKPNNLKLPLRDGDAERPDDKVFAGCYFLNANSNRRPGVVDLNKNELFDKDELYSGCYCRFGLDLYPYSASGNNGVAVGLVNVQKVADGPRLGGGISAEDDFDDDYTDDEDDSLSGLL